MTQPDRAEAMGRRLDRTARRLGIHESGRTLLLQSFRLAMEPRRKRILEDHHPDYLHPARSMLILMDDCRMDDHDLLATAALAETRDPTLSPPLVEVERLSRPLADRVSRIPTPAEAGDLLLERLLALGPGLLAVAVAERLDHARHLHLRERPEWVGYHERTCRVYAPVASRAHAALAARLEWWCETFRTRYLGTAEGEA